MATDTDLKLYRSETVSDSAGNGGRMSANEIASGADSNIFAAAGGSELAAGSIKKRKVFPKWADVANSVLQFVKAFIDQYTLGDDIVTFVAGTQTDVQSDLTGSEKKYGCGKLDGNVIATATSMTVLVEDGTDHTFVDADLIRITDKTDVDDLSGNEEFVTIVGTPSVLADVITITFTPALANGYSASLSRVMNVYEPADQVASIANVTVTSAAGTFNADNLLADNIGSVEHHVTGTFSSATVFNLVSDILGSLGAGNIGAGASPNNADFGKPHFVMQSAGFGGTFIAGDLIEFDVHPASFAVWFIKEIPPGTAALTPNKFRFAVQGETPPV
jgi:hypothetical protein